MGERKRETVKQRERERKKNVPKLYAYNEWEHSEKYEFKILSK